MACAACFTGGTHDFSEPQGRLETIYGLNTYVTGDNNASSQSVILYLPDIFSLKLVNNKLLADRYAKGTGCKVLFPDIVNNGGAEPAAMPHMENLVSKEVSILNRIWALFHLFPTIYLMIRSDSSKKFPEVLKYARAIKNDLPAGAKLGVAGFCWGGYGSTNLCSEPAIEGGSERLIDAQFCGHPSQLKSPQQVLDAVSKFKVPYSCAVAENDFMFNAEEARKAEAALREKVGPAEENNYEFTVYKGASHGFCVRAKQEQMEDYEKAGNQAVDWFNKYLK